MKEIAFETGGDLLMWIETQPHRDRTRTTRNYFIGRRYIRENNGHGGDRRSDGIKWQKVPLEKTCERIAAEEGCSEKHVRNCGKLAAHIDAVCRPGGGMEWLRDPILTERIRYSAKLLDELNDLGAGGCRDEVEALLEESKDKPVSPAAVAAGHPW